MEKVIAALDNSLAAGAVLATAANLARLFEADVEAVHVGEDGDAVAQAEARAAGRRLRKLRGETVPALVEATEAEDVAALVVGTRRLPLAGRLIGSTALEVITSVAKPVAVVPPNAVGSGSFKRVLVPLEGTVSTSAAPRQVIELAHDAELEVVVLHVHDLGLLPAFTDQRQHETDAWGQEFVARYCPWGVGDVRIELRVGRSADEILAVAAETGSDLIALGWSQELAAGRALVVREVLERGRIPVLLVPILLETGSEGRREESWTGSLSSLA